MTQIRISDSGELEIAPTTWDGEPLYSPATVQEGLFASDAFEQMPGQTSMSTDRVCVCGAEATWTHPRTGEASCQHPACTFYQTLRALA
jgi:hypothetical protein